MKTVSELIIEQETSTPPTIDKIKPHHLNLIMNYNGGKRGRKSEEEQKKISKDLRFKVERKVYFLSFD